MSLENPMAMRESPERGREVEIVLKFQRHGLREGNDLTPEGREITRAMAEQSDLHVANGEFNAAKAIGSPVATPVATTESPNPMSRALETAHITATTVAGLRSGEWNARPEERLSYENIKSPRPYDHLKIYNEALATSIRNLGKGDLQQKDLTKEEQIKVTEEAQAVTIRHVSALDTPEARLYKKENAGMFADLLEHYIKMPDYLKNKSKVLYVAGTHGGTMEWLLQEALVRTDTEGNNKVGLESFDEIGGGFNSSDTYNVDIKTDKDGKLQVLRLTFDNPSRPQEEMYLDREKIKELASFYRGLHADEISEK